MRILVLALLCLVMASTAFSQSAVDVKPYNIHVHPPGNVFIFYATVNSGASLLCGGYDRWSINLNAAGAKEVMTLITTAEILGRTITVDGNGLCDPGGYGSYISTVWLNP